LVGRRRAKSISRGEQDAATFVVLTLREFANRRGLADAVHPHEQPHGDAVRVGLGRRGTIAGERVQQYGAERRRDSLRRAIGSQFVQHRLRHGDADVRAQQHFLDHVQLLGADLTRTGE
jgi:hypothetical protein